MLCYTYIIYFTATLFTERVKCSSYQSVLQLMIILALSTNTNTIQVMYYCKTGHRNRYTILSIIL